MPWTVDNPPSPAKNKPKKVREACVKAANAALKDGKSEKEAIFACLHQMNLLAGKKVLKLRIVKENQEGD